MIIVKKNSVVLKKTKKSPRSIGIFYINLNRSPDRRAVIDPLCQQLAQQLSHYHCIVERIEAVDGQSLSVDDLNNHVDKKAFQKYRGRLPRLGEIACSLSHHQTLTTFLNKELDMAIIFEDDAVFDPVLLAELITECLNHTHTWDVLNLQNSHRGSPLGVKKLSKNHRIVQFFGHIGGASGYLINRPAAQRYKDYFFPICLQYDYFYTRSWEFGILFRGIKPSPVSQVFEKSYINTSQLMEKTTIDQKNTLPKIMFLVLSATCQILRNIKEYVFD